MKPILYSYFRSSASYRVRIALHFKEIDFEYQAVHLLKDGGQQNALNYKAINPMGQVPALVDGMNVISQSMAIISYLDSKWPQISLISKDLATKTQQIEFCEIINSGVQPLVNLSVRQKLQKDFNATDEQVREWCQTFMKKGLEACEKKLAKHAGDYCFGNKVSIADVFLVPAVFGALGQGLSLDGYPVTKKVYENLKNIEAFKKAHPQNQPDSPMDN